MARGMLPASRMSLNPPLAPDSSRRQPPDRAADAQPARDLRSPACSRPWTLRRTGDGATVIVTFRGKLSAGEGRASAEAFAMEIAREPALVVWNLIEMTGYEPAARVAWQHALWPLRHRIRGIEVVGGNPVVRIGAVTLTMVLGIEARFIETAHAEAARTETAHAGTADAETAHASHTAGRERPAGAIARGGGRQAA